MRDFISEHIIKSIKEGVIYKKKVLGSEEGWFFFDKEIKPTDSDRRSKIWFSSLNRINQYNVYQKDKLLPVSWLNIRGKELLEIYNIIKNNDFHSYKKIDGKSHKVRIKKR